MHLRRKAAVCVVVGVMSVFTCAAFARAAGEAPRIAREEVRPLIGDPGVIILDARTSWAWEGSDKKIKGAVRVDPANVDSWAGSLPKGKMIVVYCS